MHRIKWFFFTVFLPCLLTAQVHIDLGNFQGIPLKGWEVRNETGSPDVWDKMSANAIRRAPPGSYRLRTQVLLSGEQDPLDVLALRIMNFMSAWELYWDGELVYQNGSVGSEKRPEQAGLWKATVEFSREMTTPGMHEIEIVSSNHRGPHFERPFSLVLAYRESLQRSLQFQLDRQLLYIGIYLTAILFCLALYLGTGRPSSYLLFAIYCLFRLVATSLNYLGDTMPMTLNGYTAVWICDNIGSALEQWLLNVFLLYHFRLSRKGLHMAAMASVLTIILLTGIRYLFIIDLIQILMPLFGCGLLISAFKNKRPGSAIALTGIVVLFFTNIYTLISLVWRIVPVPPKFLFSMTNGFFLACVILAISRSIQEKERRYEEMRLRSQRLESELLKKSIQPHFIMNTLQTIQSWFVKDPRKAEEMIRSLAEEFRIIHRVASEKEIPLEEELRLCRLHLDLMGSRREAEYRLEVDGNCKEKTIPPMVLHTLIENGLTHAYLPKENGTFRLVCAENENGIRYRLTNDGSRLQDWSSQPMERIEEGLGLKYVKARLEERFPGHWKLDCGMREGFWEVSIVIQT